MITIHDSGYKKLFSNKVIFRQLIEAFIPEAWVKDLDFDNCETLDKSFISDHYKETESDIIYKISLKQKEIYIVILLEFQSSVDRFMALRVLNYVTNFYMDYLDSNKGINTLPPVFPIVLYNGDKRWTAPTKIADLIYHNDLLGQFSINFEYFKIAEIEYSKGDLLKIRNIVSTLFLAETHYDLELLKQEFLEIFHKEEDKQAVSLFFNWFRQLSEYQRINEEDFRSLELVYKNAEEVDAMLIKSIQKERSKLINEGIEKGLEQGIEKGLEQGIEKGKARKEKEIILRMHQQGVTIKDISKYTNIPQEDIIKILNLQN
jgi:predicted transposase/invertase (TIGR01784 family)